MNKWKLFKNGGIGIVTIDVKTLPSVYSGVNAMLEIDEVLIDPDFSGDLLAETEKEIELFYSNENLNGLQDMSGVMGYKAPNSAEEDVLDFEKLPDERYFTQNNTRMSTFNSLKHGNYHRFLECDLNETYSRLSEHTGVK